MRDPSGGVEEVPPYRRGMRGASIRRYVSLRETHLRLCTFASPRRVPVGHEDRWVYRQMGVETDGL